MTKLTELPQGRILNTSVEGLKKQAKAILKAHRNGESSCCDVLRQINRLKGKSDTDILSAKTSLVEVQFALALDHGFRDWKHLTALLGSSEQRVVEKLDDGYRYTYSMAALKDPKQTYFDYSALTMGEQVRNCFDNELASLQALADVPWVPGVIDADPARMLMVVEDLGDLDPLFGREHAGLCMSRLSDLHGHHEVEAIPLNRTWMSVVSQDWHFNFDDAKKDVLMRTPFGEVLDAIPQLKEASAAFPCRYTHGASGTDSFVVRDGHTGLIHFRFAHSRYQMEDVVDVCTSLGNSGPVPTFKEWMGWWDKYASFRETCTDEDLREFLYLSIRRSARRLSKRKPIPHEGFGKYLIDRAVQSLGELNTLSR